MILDWGKTIEILIDTLVCGFLLWLMQKYWEPICRFFIRLWLLHFPLKPFNVVFSIQSKSDMPSGSYNNELKIKIKENLDQLGLSNIVRLKDFEDLKYFKNREEAEAFLIKHELDLIWWGRFSEDKLKSKGKTNHELLINYTYKYPEDNQGQVRKVIADDIQAAIVNKRHFSIIEDESFRDIRIASDDLTDLSLYIVGSCMLLFGRLNETVLIFEKLFDRNNKNSDDFVEKVKLKLGNAYELLSIKFGLDGRNYSEGLEFSEKLLKLFPGSHNGLANSAYFLVMLERMEDAGKTVERLKSRFPDSHTTLIDLAFFEIIQKNYNEAFDYYLKIASIPPDELKINVVAITEFLENQYIKLKHEPAFLFGVGILNYYFADRMRGLGILKDFLEKAQDDKYLRMIKKANELLMIN